jgi:D-amino-acid oxidase
VIGLTAAVCLAESGFGVRLISDRRPLKTASANSGAIWGPFLSALEPRVREWSFETYTEFERLARRGVKSVQMLPGTFAAHDGLDIPSWVKQLPGAVECRRDALPEGYVSGYRYVSPVVDMPAYLGYLRRRLASRGTHLEIAHVTSLAERAFPEELIVNCTGLGSIALAADHNLSHSRGFLVVVDNPGLEEFFSERGDGPNLVNILPQGDKIVLGGTVDAAEDLEPDEAVLQAIVDRCAAIFPELLTSPRRGYRAGLRPCRTTVRFGCEQLDGHDVIHSYGHGGSGVSVSWGAGRAVASLAAELRR